VHIAVICIPLLALLVVAFVARPAWRPGLAVPVALLALLTLAGTVLAASSGGNLREHVQRTALVRRHAELGGQLQTIGVAFCVAVLALVAVDALRRRPKARLRLPWTRPALVVSAVAALLLAGVAMAWDVRAGHSGAEATWRGRLLPSPEADPPSPTSAPSSARTAPGN
jgi:predicted transporter